MGPFFLFGRDLSSLMERSSYNGRKMENDEENQCLFPQGVEWPIAMVLVYSKEKRGFSRED
jgi:hypothetical protein